MASLGTKCAGKFMKVSRMALSVSQFTTQAVGMRACDSNRQNAAHKGVKMLLGDAYMHRLKIRATARHLVCLTTGFFK